jgi:nucleoside-diphosphate-sugar epimerase
LLEHEAALGKFETFHFRGHWDADGSEMVAAIRRVAGAQVKVRKLPWSLLWLATPFVLFVREMMEMRYLWRESFALDNTRLRALLGEEPHTPIDVAVRATLAGIGSLPPQLA